MKGIITTIDGKISPDSMLPPGYWMRSARMEDLKEVVRLVNLSYQELLGQDRFSIDELGRDWTMPGFYLNEDSQVAFDQMVKL